MVTSFYGYIFLLLLFGLAKGALWPLDFLVWVIFGRVFFLDDYKWSSFFVIICSLFFYEEFFTRVIWYLIGFAAWYIFQSLIYIPRFLRAVGVWTILFFIGKYLQLSLVDLLNLMIWLLLTLVSFYINPKDNRRLLTIAS